MSDNDNNNEQTDREVKRPVLTLISNSGESREVTPRQEETGIEDSIEELQDFMDEVLSQLDGNIASPISAVCIVMVHEDGGVSHGHSCTDNELLKLIGALGIKQSKLESSYKKGRDG